MIKIEITPPSINNFRYGAIVVHYVDYIETRGELVSSDARLGVLRGLGGRNAFHEILFAIEWEDHSHRDRAVAVHPNNIRYVAQSQDGD